MLDSPSTRCSVFARVCAAVVLLTALAGCAATPDPEETRESLAEVTQEPSAPVAADEYSVETRPQPVVEPVECSPYLIITARGTGEPTKGQLLSPVARLIAEARPVDTQTVDLDYPASGEVKESATVGVRFLIDTLNVQTRACPDQQFILLGYSQGAMVVGDSLVAPEHRMVGATVGTATERALQRILAIVLYGDPRFVGAEPYNVGDYDDRVDGLLPRAPGALAHVADRLRDYCVARDFVCQSSLDLDERGHVRYFDNGMQQDGAAFAITRLAPLDDARSEDAEDAESGGTERPEAPSS